MPGLQLALRHLQKPKKRGRPPIANLKNLLACGTVNKFQNYGCCCRDCKDAWNRYRRDRRKVKAKARAAAAEQRDANAEILKVLAAQKAKTEEAERNLKEWARRAELAALDDYTPND